jgi:predicted CoA-binding protein
LATLEALINIQASNNNNNSSNNNMSATVIQTTTNTIGVTNIKPPPPSQTNTNHNNSNDHHRTLSQHSAANDVLKLFTDTLPLDAIFRPQSVALIGASEKPGSVGRTVLWNLLSSPFGGTIYPVNCNPKRRSVFGIKSYARLQSIPDIQQQGIDLAIIAVPAHAVKQVMLDCVEVGVRGAIILSAGFKEVGIEGAKLEREVRDIAQRGKIRVVGPNCLGVQNPITGLNATFATASARPGNVAFISQSGAMCTSILDWSLQAHVGFSAFISTGSMMDVSWGDIIYYLGDDPNTKVNAFILARLLFVEAGPTTDHWYHSCYVAQLFLFVRLLRYIWKA